MSFQKHKNMEETFSYKWDESGGLGFQVLLKINIGMLQFSKPASLQDAPSVDFLAINLKQSLMCQRLNNENTISSIKE